MKKALNVLKLWVVAAVAAAALSGTASAQSLVKGSFTLPYEVHFGKAVLAPGSYTISMDSTRGPAIIRTSTGSGRALVMALAVDKSLTDQPTALLISQRENQRVVRSFNWREGNTAFVYVPFTKAERKLLGKVDDSVVVPILMAQK
jgi:hypothetical protein